MHNVRVQSEPRYDIIIIIIIIITKNTIKDGGSTALYAVYAVDMVYTTDMVYMFDTVDTVYNKTK